MISAYLRYLKWPFQREKKVEPMKRSSEDFSKDSNKNKSKIVLLDKEKSDLDEQINKNRLSIWV